MKNGEFSHLIYAGGFKVRNKRLVYIAPKYDFCHPDIQEILSIAKILN